MATTREHVRKLVDALPDDRLDEARHALWLLSVPEDDEPLTDEELESIREGRAEYLRGETIPGEPLLTLPVRLTSRAFEWGVTTVMCR